MRLNLPLQYNMVKVLETFANYSGSGYFLPGQVVELSPENEKIEIDLGRAELFVESDLPVEKEEKVEKSTKEDKTKLQTKEVKVGESEGEA